MILSFRNEAAQSSWERRFRKGVPNDVARVAHRKLMQINAAVSLEDLRVSPGDRLEALTGTRQGQHSSVSTTIGACALSGETETPSSWNWWTTIEERHG